MIAVPQSTEEKPLTVIDFIAVLEQCRTPHELGSYAERVPMEMRSDERFGRAVVRRLDAIRERKPRAA